jgi:hypothetical protein
VELATSPFEISLLPRDIAAIKTAGSVGSLLYYTLYTTLALLITDSTSTDHSAQLLKNRTELK